MTKKKSNELRSTVGLKQTTKDRLDKARAPGQCYDGFLCQLLELWESNVTPINKGKKKTNI